MLARDDRGFRPDIEGLRGVAILLVLVFHADIAPLPGGFIGVDVFFIISGYLITGLLIRELRQTGTISLPQFYARRARRLLPAAGFVLVATLAASALLLPPLLVGDVARDVASAALYVSNVGFALQATDYFASELPPSPVLHYWSLGVEEQFYICWPALLLLVGVAGRGTVRVRRLALLIAGVAVASLALSVWLTGISAPWAFFSLPTRAWQLALGAIIVVAADRVAPVPAGTRGVAGWIGLALIGVGAVAITDWVPYPGFAALLPSIGAALVIAAGGAVGPAAILATTPLRFVGRISYSLYLWHWPVLVIPAIVAGASLDLEARVALVGLAILLATITQRFVEEPFRHGRIFGTLPRRTLAFAGALSLFVTSAALSVGLATGAGLSGPEGPPGPAANDQTVASALSALSSPGPAHAAMRSRRYAVAPTASHASRKGRATGSTAASTTRSASSAATTTDDPIARPPTPDGAVPANLQPSLTDARNDFPVPYLDGCSTNMNGASGGGACVYGRLNSRTTVALFGDSHALAWFPALARIADQKGWRLVAVTMSTCPPPSMPIYVSGWQRLSSECARWRESALQRIVALHADVVVLTGSRWFATTDESGTEVLTGPPRSQAWSRGMAGTLARIVPASGRVIVIAATPSAAVDPPVCLSQHRSSVLACATDVDKAINPSWIATEKAAADAGGAGFIDPQAWVCPSSPCPVTLGNLLIYRDRTHMTPEFAAALAGPLGEAILADLRGQGIALH
jgi:peptidoglycan/LPS O-acetylase OafA/YrhL